MALNVLVDSLGDEPKHEVAASRTKRAGRIAELIMDPSAKVSALLHLSSNTATAEDTIKYADRAAETAREIPLDRADAFERVRLITWTAQTSAANIARAAELAVTEDSHTQLRGLIHKTGAFFEEGRKTAAAIDSPLHIFSNHVTMAMVKAAGQIDRIAPELSDQLLADAATDTDNLLRAYVGNKEVKPGTKADSLARMGRNWVMQALPQDWDWDLGRSSSGQKAQQHVPHQAVRLFKAAAAHAQPNNWIPHHHMIPT
jgi:hypothetical protein